MTARAETPERLPLPTGLSVNLVVVRPVVSRSHAMVMLRPTVRCLLVFLLVVPATCFAGELETIESASVSADRGREIYEADCAYCHGANGGGVEDAYPDPLIGDDSIGQLSELIASTMPEGDPELVVGEDAQAVAAYIHGAFYSEAARIRNRPPRVVLQRLTADQLRQSVSDLFATVDGLPGEVDRQGIEGQYFDGSRWKKDKRKIKRVDPYIDFDFGRESPGEGIGKESFYINWEGGLKIETTGRYEIVVNSTLSMTMTFGDSNTKLIDNHVQSGDKTEFRRSLWLTGGRVYPFSIEFIQRKRKTELPPARIRLAWVPPGGVEETIPTRNLVSQWVPPAYAIQTELPPDDRSYGYERGIAVNRQWEEATTAVALEFAEVVNQRLWPRYRRRHRKDEGSDRQKLKALLSDIARLAFRGPLSDDLRRQTVDDIFESTEDDLDAVKKVCLLILKSPRFLYPTLDSEQTSSRRALNRLSLVLHDSLPTTPWMIKDANEDKWADEEAVRRVARKMVDDPRTHHKLHGFLQSWLNLEHLHDISKDQEQFPGFDEQLVFHLQRSLNWTLSDFASEGSTSFSDLITRTTTYTSNRLADYYGDAWAVSGDSPGSDSIDWDKHAFTGLVRGHDSHLRPSISADSRHGVLDHPYLMSGLSYFDHTSPIHRGVFLIRFTMGRTLRPPNAAFTPLSPDLHPDLTTRQRVELQTSPDSCQVCHSKINALGFALENLDATGRFRETDGGRPVDASGSYDQRDGTRVSFTGVDQLADYVQGSDDAIRGFVNRAFQHFTKQPAAAYGPNTLDELVADFDDSGGNLRDLVIEIATIAATRPLTDE